MMLADAGNDRLPVPYKMSLNVTVFFAEELLQEFGLVQWIVVLSYPYWLVESNWHHATKRLVKKRLQI